MLTSFKYKKALRFHLGVCTDGLLALGAGVGAQLVKALDAHVLLILLHALLAVQVVAAVEAVDAVGHGGGEVTPGTCGSDSERESPFTHQWGALLPHHLAKLEERLSHKVTLEVSRCCCCCYDCMLSEY